MKKTIDFTLIIFIGPGKSGSSAIQSIATEYSEELKKQYCFYLGVMFENSPAQLYSWQNALDGPKHIIKQDSESENELYQVLLSSIEKLSDDNYQSAIWANESTLKSGSMTINVLNKLAQSGIRVITYSYVRCHEDLIKSAYIQWGIILKKYKGPVKPFREWIKQYKYLLYPYIQSWLNQDFEFNLKNYDAIDDVVADFFQSNQLELSNYVKSKKINSRPNKTLLSMWAEFNSIEDNEKIAYDFKKIAKPSGILDKQYTIPNINDLLPSPSDIEEITRKTKEDKELINKLLIAEGQPALSSPTVNENEESNSFEQLWELHMYSLNMIFSLQEELSEHKNNTKDQFQKFSERMAHDHAKTISKMAHIQHSLAKTNSSMTHGQAQTMSKMTHLEAKVEALQTLLNQVLDEKVKQ